MSGESGVRPFALRDGPEGQNLELLERQRKELRPLAIAYRYWAPP